MENLSILIILYSAFILFVSSAEIPKFTPSLIVSKSDPFPEYPLLHEHLHKSLPRHDFESTLTPEKFDCNHDDTFLSILEFLNYKTIALLSLTSKAFYKKVNTVIDEIFGRMGIKSCGIDLSRKDNFIVAFPLVSLFQQSFPGLIDREKEIFDFISCCLIALIVSAEIKFESNLCVEPACPRYKELKTIFMESNFVRMNIDNVPLWIFPTIFRNPQNLMYYFLRIFRYVATPNALSVFPLLHQKLGIIKNRLYNDISILLYVLALSMASKDQRFLDNLIISATPQELLTARSGYRHLLHELITKDGTYNSDIFKISNLGSVKIDKETGLSFYSAAIFYALKHHNISVIKGLLNDFPNEAFVEFRADKLEILRNFTDLSGFIEKFSGFDEHNLIMNFLTLE